MTGHNLLGLGRTADLESAEVALVLDLQSEGMAKGAYQVELEELVAVDEPAFPEVGTGTVAGDKNVVDPDEGVEALVFLGEEVEVLVGVRDGKNRSLSSSYASELASDSQRWGGRRDTSRVP